MYYSFSDCQGNINYKVLNQQRIVEKERILGWAFVAKFRVGKFSLIILKKYQFPP